MQSIGDFGIRTAGFQNIKPPLPHVKCGLLLATYVVRSRVAAGLRRRPETELPKTNNPGTRSRNVDKQAPPSNMVPEGPTFTRRPHGPLRPSGAGPTSSPGASPGFGDHRHVCRQQPTSGGRQVPPRAAMRLSSSRQPVCRARSTTHLIGHLSSVFFFLLRLLLQTYSAAQLQCSAHFAAFNGFEDFRSPITCMRAAGPPAAR